jgi:hypothetical protein
MTSLTILTTSGTDDFDVVDMLEVEFLEVISYAAVL